MHPMREPLKRFDRAVSGRAVQRACLFRSAFLPQRGAMPAGRERRAEHLEARVNPQAIGRTRWAIAEGYIPPESNGPAPTMTSHETACLLNAGDEAANVAITIYFTDREPCGPYRVTVPPRRTLHLRFNDLRDPEPVPRGTDYASVIESDVPIVVQHTRLDSRQAEEALLSTMAYPQ
jgi:hypothetical protein